MRPPNALSLPCFDQKHPFWPPGARSSGPKARSPGPQLGLFRKRRNSHYLSLRERLTDGSPASKRPRKARFFAHARIFLLPALFPALHPSRLRETPPSPRPSASICGCPFAPPALPCHPAFCFLPHCFSPCYPFAARSSRALLLRVHKPITAQHQVRRTIGPCLRN
jgi:hypothetical protein